jgi:N-acetylmuramoyl-L-alanine amidase
MGAGSSIIICGQRFDIGHKVITWEDDNSINAYRLTRTDDPTKIFPFSPAKGLGQQAARLRPRRLMGGDRSLERLRGVISQFVVHHDGCFDSRTCFHVLHNERGLSVHFLIDWDGTIFQTLDLVDCAFQAAGVNEIAVGVELASRGDAFRFPNDYTASSGPKMKREKVTCTINGSQFLAYAYHKVQIEAMQAIGKCLARIFPGLPQVYPAEGDGEPIWNSLTDPRGYKGYLGHYHITNQKWDPGPFDFKEFTTGIRSRMFYPVVLGATETATQIPEDPEKQQDTAEQLYENNEKEGEGGYFPVGPYGESKLWHGGVHIRTQKGTPVFAPFAGRVVGARMTGESPIGSRNFVLLKHQLTVKAQTINFWTLFFHLDEESAGAHAPNWYNKASSQMADDPVGLNIDVAGGELIGHVGEAGPPGRMDGQMHFEVMSTEELHNRIQPGFWKVIDGAGMGRFCTAPDVLDKIDKPGPPKGKRDNLLSRNEFRNFFTNDPKREEFHKLAVRHLTEWADNNDWEVALNRSTDFAALPKMTRQKLFKDQVEPVLWWNDEVAEAAGLPGDKIVWNYHPITFLFWIHDQQQRARSTARGISNAADFKGQKPASFLKDDSEATDGFTDDEDALFGEAGKHLELEDLAKGYSDDKDDILK